MNNVNNKDISAQEEIRKIKINSLKILILWFLSILLYLIYWVYFEEDTLIENKSPFGNKEVIITELGNGFIKDSERVKIYFKEDGKTRKSKKIDVDNFLESNSAGRYHITWGSDNNSVTISMVFERSHQGLNYNFSTNTIEMNLNQSLKPKYKK